MASTLSSLAICAVLVGIVLGRSPDWLSFLLLVLALVVLTLAGYLAWRTWACLSLSYLVDRNAVTIQWGPVRQVIPLGQIRQVIRPPAAVGSEAGQVTPAVDALELRQPAPPSETDDPATPGPLLSVEETGTTAADSDAARARAWPPGQRLTAWIDRWVRFGTYLDREHRYQGHRVTSLATWPPADQLWLETPQLVAGISPADPSAFLRALEQHHRLGPTRLLLPERQRPRLARALIWSDRVGLGLLAAGFLGVLVLLGVLMQRYPSLAPDGRPVGGALPGGMALNSLFWFPAFATAIWLLNGIWGLLIYRQQRVASLILWAGTLAAQAVLLTALLGVS